MNAAARQGFDAAVMGEGILTNPHANPSPAFNHWVDGWCAFHAADKGLLNGKCNRGACMNRPATWFSSVEQAHYCDPCATEINKWVPPQVAKITKVTT